MLKPNQLRLPFPSGPFDRASLIVSTSNQDVLASLDAWQQWPDRTLLIIGDEATGKSHIGNAWATEAGAARLTAQSVEALALPDMADLAATPVFLDDADKMLDHDQLFHLLNLIVQRSGTLVMTARCAPAHWGITLGDLASRLAAVRIIALHQPTDNILSELLSRGAARRGIILDEVTRKAILTRMDRSFAAAATFIEAFDSELTRRPGVSPSTLARGAMAALYPGS